MGKCKGKGGRGKRSERAEKGGRGGGEEEVSVSYLKLSQGAHR